MATSPGNTLILTSAVGPKDRTEIVREAYKKHATELLAIEEAQQKLVLLLLGIFGAGTSFLASEKASVMRSLGARVGVTVVVTSILIISGVYTFNRNAARTSVRALLVRCELALGFFEVGAYVSGEPLYPVDHKWYASRGGWLGWTYWLAVLAGVGLLLVVWSGRA